MNLDHKMCPRRTACGVAVADRARAAMDLLPRALLGDGEVVRVELHARLCQCGISDRMRGRRGRLTVRSEAKAEAALSARERD